MARHTQQTIREQKTRFPVRMTILHPDEGWGYEGWRNMNHWLKERTRGDYFTISASGGGPSAMHIYFSDPRIIDEFLKRFQHLRLRPDPKAGSGAEEKPSYG